MASEAGIEIQNLGWESTRRLQGRSKIVPDAIVKKDNALPSLRKSLDVISKLQPLW